MTKKSEITVEFGQWICDLDWSTYSYGGRIALTLYEKDNHDEGPICMATVNIESAKLNPGEGLIKDWSENEGVLAALVKAGVVEDTGRVVPTGFVVANVVRWLVGPGAVK